MIRWTILLSLLVADQASKWWYQMRDLVVMNRGGVFGILPSIWWGLLLLFVWVILVLYWIGKPWTIARWGMGLIIVGGLGNIIDRLYFGSVRDFIYYPIIGFYGNVADILLALGVIVVMLSQIAEVNEQVIEESTSR